MGAFRRVLIRTIRYFVTRPLAAIGLVAGLVAVVAAILILPGLLGSPTLNGRSLAVPRGAGGEPVATEEFMRANRDFRGDLLWSSFSDEARAQLQSSGAGPQAFQSQMEAAKQSGVKFEEVSYIGGKDLPDGTSKQFYLVKLRPGAQAEVEYISFMFTLDRTGKIAKVQ